MARGSNSEVEQGRVSSREDAPERAATKGTGPASHEKTGYGRSSMQKNSDSKRKTNA